MTYAACLDYLFGLQRHGIKLGLDNITRLLARLNHPQHRFPVLHIGGTNGKGSTAVITAAVLQTMGFRVGLYTSPHLVDFRERIRVQGTCISEESVLDFVSRFLVPSSTHSDFTFFEAATALAFHRFADEHVDIAVVEVGMGGRFDATNVCQSIGTLVTTIAFDHEEYLGHTLPAIAFEKAGIFKPGTPVVLGRIIDPAMEVLIEQAKMVGAPTYRYDQDFSAKAMSPGVLDYQGIEQSYESLLCPLEGPHQVINTANALALLEVSAIPGLSLTEDAIRQGLNHVIWEGRLECVSHEPLVYLDGAHNPAGAQAISDFLSRVKSDSPNRKLILVLGMMRDKNIGEFMRVVAPMIDVLILTKIDHPRAATLVELKMAVPKEIGVMRECGLVSDAWNLAHQLAQSHDLICVTGSLFLVGHIKSLMSGCHYAPIVG